MAHRKKFGSNIEVIGEINVYFLREIVLYRRHKKLEYHKHIELKRD